ncbi:MAG: hypothetical protein HYS73_00025 [Parcubacteria group bacterium]|nr:hypothetical protein [Parcubacteria group bacterium]MBI2049241.1 hypothetical protein [Parcubacteria group bacterium]
MINFLRAWKFETGFLLIIATALAVWAGTVYLSPEARKAREANDYLERLQAEYANDTYGGATPEETLALFIAALEKGDIELASKYFLPEDREEIKNDIKSAEEAGRIRQSIERFKDLSLETKNGQKAFFITTDANGLVQTQVILDKNPNGVWKISDI